MNCDTFPGNREEPLQYEYAEPLECENCGALYGDEHEPCEICCVGYDVNGKAIYLCWECRPGFTCDACDHLGIQPTDENGLGDCCRLKVRAA